MGKIIDEILSKLKFPWDKAKEILGESRGSRLIAVGIFLMFLTSYLRVLSARFWLEDNFSSLFWMLAFLLIFWGHKRTCLVNKINKIEGAGGEMIW